MFVLLEATMLVLPDPARADKSYRLTLTNVSKAGSIELQPGDYNLVLDTRHPGDQGNPARRDDDETGIPLSLELRSSFD